MSTSQTSQTRNRTTTRTRKRPKTELDGQAMNLKSIANYSVSEDGTIHSSMTLATTYSPHASPPIINKLWNGEQLYYQGSPSHHVEEWVQQGGHIYLQPYYPPPAELSTSAMRLLPHEISAKLSDVSSPTSGGSPDMRYQVPTRGLQWSKSTGLLSVR